MQTAEHRCDDNRLAQVLMANATRDVLPDPLMGSSLIEVDPVLANQRIQVPVAEQDDVVEQLTPATTSTAGMWIGRAGSNNGTRRGINVGGVYRSWGRTTLAIALCHRAFDKWAFLLAPRYI